MQIEKSERSKRDIVASRENGGIFCCRFSDGVGITYGDGAVYANRYTGKSSVNSLTVNPLSYQTYPWSGEDAEVGRVYDIQAITGPCKFLSNIYFTLSLRKMRLYYICEL